MSRTLFRYIFWDLVKIFMMASGVLSAIMSFGGLLKPLYEVGLDFSQVGQILGFSGPAMTAYSLPIAALFATTIVYGRLGADNEITACRAAGISHLALAFPAFILGTLCAFISLGLLCFVVPASMLKVEKIIYSNLAQLAVGQIERTHKVKFDLPSASVTIFAQSAKVLPSNPDRPRDQAMQVDGALFVRYMPTEPTARRAPLVPEDFFLARQAIAYIQQEHEDDDAVLSVDLFEGTRFPRPTTGPAPQTAQVSIQQQRFGPFPLRSSVSENTKFMNIFSLQNLLKYPEHSRRIGELLREYVRRDQSQTYLKLLETRLNESDSPVDLDSGDEAYRLYRMAQPAQVKGDRLVITGTPKEPVRMLKTRGAQSPFTATASQIRIRAFPHTDRRKVELEVEMLDSQFLFPNEEPTTIENRSKPILVAMPDSIVALTTRPAAAYRNGGLPTEDRLKLERNILKQDNSVRSELHARMSFAVSCYILVMIGCALGMMFRSGNFLSAFAVSVVPALMCIALVVTGQHTCENVPSAIPTGWTNPYRLGVALIWSGNIAVAISAIVLLGRLQRQ